MPKTDNGFLFFFDWVKPFGQLSGDEFKEIFFAMIEYQQNGTPPPEYEGTLGIVASFVFPQLERRKACSEAGRAGMSKRWDKGANNGVNNTLINKSITQDKTKTRHRQDKDIDTSTPNPPKGADAITERFDTFWKAYPKKTGKGAAEKAFQKIKPSGDLLQKMLKAIEAQKRSDQWQRDNGQFIPLPTTWLNQKRWEDDCNTSIKIETSNPFFEYLKSTADSDPAIEVDFTEELS